MDRIEASHQVSTNGIPRARPVPTAEHRGADADGFSTNPSDFEIVSDQTGTRPAGEQPRDLPKPSWWQRNRKWFILGAILLALIAAFLVWGLPIIREMLDTVSTDDAFVNGHVTYVSPRVDGVITEVLVDQNDRVLAGTLLLRLDREPFDVKVAQSEANLEEAKAQFAQSKGEARTQLAKARASYYQRKNAQEQLRRQIATLRARVATLRAQQSSEALASVDQRRIENLTARGSATQAELDERNNTLKVAQEQVKEARASIQEARAVLGLAPNEEAPLEIPPDLVKQQSTIQSADSDIAGALAAVGIVIDTNDVEGTKSFEEFLEKDGGDLGDNGLDSIIEAAPGVKVAAAAVRQAERQLQDAQLQLSYTEIFSEIAGYVQDRSANPGNRVEPGQTLMSIRPDEIWIEANYKETQIRYMKIGDPVDVEVDAYPDRVFKGRVSGFSPGTGLSESLLPPQNATGNYVKVTQRLPIRIDLVEPNPPETPLFIGLSVVPKVRFKERPTGPGAGQRLHSPRMTAAPDVGDGPAGSLPRNRPDVEGGRP